MKIQGLFKHSIHSLSRHKLRTFLSTLGIVFGVTAIIAMVSIGEGAKRETLALIEQLGRNNIILRSLDLTESQEWAAKQSYSGGLRLSDVERIRARTPDAEKIAPVVNVKAALPNAPKGVNPEIVSTTQAYQEILDLPVAEGRFLCAKDVKRKNLCCCIGWDVLKGLGPAGHIGQTIRIENIAFTIVGILQRRGWNSQGSQPISVRNVDRMILIPLGAEWAIQDVASDESRLSEIVIRLAADCDIPVTSNLVRDIVHEAHRGAEDFSIVIPREILNQAKKTHALHNAVLGCIAAISLLVGGIGIMNIMLATISERNREVGIRRAVGANQSHIFLQFLIEAVLLTLIGGALGIIGGVFASVQIANFIGWKTVVTGWAVSLSLITSVLVGICSGTYPAIRAARMDPIEALRFE
jgi:putative ABC transport system permease protein